ncbi:hypothetical protein HOF92_01990, partial [bacterium]|nr:hypothetical protein [bacterium]
MPKAVKKVANSSSFSTQSFTEAYGRYLKYSRVKDQYNLSVHDQYYSLALSVRDEIINRWMETQTRY